jgi:hypothetical protein
LLAQLDKDVIKIRPALVPRRLISYALFEGRPLTTRGRWINPLVFAQLRLVEHLPQIRSVSRPIYILGTGRSGTTILGMLFHLHPQCGFLNEPKAMWHAIFPYEDLIGSYSNGPAFYRLAESEVTDAIRRRAHRLFGHYLLLTGAGRVVDKYPELIFRLPFVRGVFPDAKFIFLVRNGLDTLRSIASWSGRHEARTENEIHDWWGANRRKWKLLIEQVAAHDECLSPIMDQVSTFDRQEDMAAVEWILTMREGRRWIRDLPHAVYPLRYENLLKNPRKTLAALLDFCALPVDRAMFDYAEKVLLPRPEKSAVDLHPSIKDGFYQTMAEMGYGD